MYSTMASNKTMFHRLFNEKMDEFAKDLVAIASDNPAIQKGFVSFRSLFTILKNLSPMKPQQIFTQHVETEFRDYIIRSDDMFFLETAKYTVGGPTSEAQYWLEFIDKLKSVWAELDEGNKAVVWKYLKVLIALSDRCRG